MSRRNRYKGFWPAEVYEQYVEKHTSGTERQELLDPRGEVWDRSYDNIILANDSMPQWLAANTIVSLNDRDINFPHLLAMYRIETRRHISGVRGWMEQIKIRATGRALLTELGSSKAKKKSVRIVPYRGKGANAYERPDSKLDGTDKWRLLNPTKFGDLRTGTGKGSDTYVEFTPDVYRGAAMRAPSDAPDEVLFHELVHASRTMKGKSNQAYVNRDYDDEEEYLSVVLTNIYMSEKGQWVFAGDHGSGLLQGDARDRFLDNVQKANLSPMQLLDNFKASQPDFYDELAKLPPDRPKYNWVRQHNDRRKFQQAVRPRDRTGIF